LQRASAFILDTSAAARLYREQGDGNDLRMPIACALVELYGVNTPDQAIAVLVEAMLPIEADELVPPRGGTVPLNG
jgi:hypothetical protein